VAEQQISDSDVAAFFRWQEWVPFRRQAVPVTDEARADLLFAEARILADAAEPAAAHDAASLALEQYNTCEQTEAIRAKLQELARFTAGLGPDAGPAIAIRSEPEAVVPPDVGAEAQQLESYLTAVNSEEALSLLKRINVLAGNAPMATGYPFWMRPTAVMVSVRRPGATPTSWLHAMSNLRLIDPFRYKLMIEMLKLKTVADSQTDTRLADWLKGDELA